jgi:uncharacterized protein YndB with AHSA1/START domain
MGAVQRDIVINAPPEKVFAYIADLTRHPEWAQHKIEIRQTSQGEVKVGSTFTSGHIGKPPRDIVTIVELVPNSRFVLEAKGHEGHDRWTFHVQPDGDGTRLTKSFENLSLPLLMKVAAPAVALGGGSRL